MTGLIKTLSHAILPLSRQSQLITVLYQRSSAVALLHAITTRNRLPAAQTQSVTNIGTTNGRSMPYNCTMAATACNTASIQIKMAFGTIDAFKCICMGAASSLLKTFCGDCCRAGRKGRHAMRRHLLRFGGGLRQNQLHHSQDPEHTTSENEMHPFNFSGYRKWDYRHPISMAHRKHVSEMEGTPPGTSQPSIFAFRIL